MSPGVVLGALSVWHRQCFAVFPACTLDVLPRLLPVVLRLVLCFGDLFCTGCCWLSGCCRPACMLYTPFCPGSSDPTPFLVGVLFSFLWAPRDSRHSAVGSWLALGVVVSHPICNLILFGLFGLLRLPIPLHRLCSCHGVLWYLLCPAPFHIIPLAPCAFFWCLHFLCLLCY